MRAAIFIGSVLACMAPLLFAQDPEITARIVAGGPESLAGIVVEAAKDPGNYKREFVASGDAFRLLLQPGQYRIAFRGLPLGYTVSSMRYGNADLLRSTLNFGDGNASGPIRVTLTSVSVDSIPGRHISGPVRGLPAASGSAKVTVVGIDAGGPSIETPVRADSTFEFATVPPGRYMARVWPADGSVPQGVTVAPSNIGCC